MAWKGVTVGGAVLRLQVVRVDGKPLTFVVSLVRALGAAFSIAAAGLGYFWTGWDSEKVLRLQVVRVDGANR